MRNLSRISNYWNNVQARHDWQHIAKQAEAAGRDDLIKKYQPAGDAGWRKIDAAIAAVRAALNEEKPYQYDSEEEITSELERDEEE
jgi:hypothetical protein